MIFGKIYGQKAGQFDRQTFCQEEKWFCWKPVRLDDDGRWVWLQYIYRTYKIDTPKHYWYYSIDSKQTRQIKKNFSNQAAKALTIFQITGNKLPIIALYDQIDNFDNKIFAQSLKDVVNRELEKIENNEERKK